MNNKKFFIGGMITVIVLVLAIVVAAIVISVKNHEDRPDSSVSDSNNAGEAGDNTTTIDSLIPQDGSSEQDNG